MKKRDVGMAEHISKKYGKDELSITLYLQSEINYCSVRMLVNAWCYIPTHCLQNHHQYCIILSWIRAFNINKLVVNLAEAGL